MQQVLSILLSCQTNLSINQTNLLIEKPPTGEEGLMAAEPSTSKTMTTPGPDVPSAWGLIPGAAALCVSVASRSGD